MMDRSQELIYQILIVAEEHGGRVLWAAVEIQILSALVGGAGY